MRTSVTVNIGFRDGEVVPFGRRASGGSDREKYRTAHTKQVVTNAVHREWGGDEPESRPQPPSREARRSTYNEGYEAAAKGVPRSKNPYPKEHELHEIWKSGHVFGSSSS